MIPLSNCKGLVFVIALLALTSCSHSTIQPVQVETEGMAKLKKLARFREVLALAVEAGCGNKGTECGQDSAANIMALVYLEEALALELELKSELTYAEYLALSSMVFSAVSLEKAKEFAGRANDLVGKLKPEEFARRIQPLVYLGSMHSTHLMMYDIQDPETPRKYFRDAEKILLDAGPNKVSASAEFNLYASWAIHEYSFGDKDHSGDGYKKKAKTALRRYHIRKAMVQLERQFDDDLTEAKIRGGLENAPETEPPPRDGANCATTVFSTGNV